MNWTKNLTLVCVSVFLTVGLFEVFLRIDGRYDNQASKKIGGPKTIWTNYANSTEYGSHPDLETPVEIRFDEYGARISSANTSKKLRSAAFFGDSFTENRQIDNYFSFIEILNLWSASHRFFNFGVDGFGLEQSYAHYLAKKDLIKFDTVFYVLCHNDLRNTYEVQMFDKSAMKQGEAKFKPGLGYVPWHIKIVSKIHLTYLGLEAYFKFKGLIQIPRAHLSAKLGQKFSDSVDSWQLQMENGYADMILQRLISSETTSADEIIVDHFKATLKKWRQDVEETGAEFYILVLPMENAVNLASILDIENAVQLERNEKFAKLSSRPWRFINDGHWNEYGNFAAALGLIDKRSQVNLTYNIKIPSALFIDRHIQKIDDLYR